MIEESLKDRSFATSFLNFISDHKSITVRIGLDGNEIKEEFKAKLTFDRESHQKSKEKESQSRDESLFDNDNSSDTSSNADSFESEKPESDDNTFTLNSSSEIDEVLPSINVQSIFRRKFNNRDNATCWLNSCLQLIMAGLDRSDSPLCFTSELGIELMRLMKDESIALDPTFVKNIIVTSEDTNIALRLSELTEEISNPVELEHQSNIIKNFRLNLLTGQQCVRDFFICLNKNNICWPDICSIFNFSTTRTSTCLGCNKVFRVETNQMYLELDVPQDNSNLKDLIEEHFNMSFLTGQICDDGCKKLNEVEKSFKMTLIDEAEFFIIILTRAVQTLDGFKLNQNKITATDNVFIR